MTVRKHWARGRQTASRLPASVSSFLSRDKSNQCEAYARNDDLSPGDIWNGFHLTTTEKTEKSVESSQGVSDVDVWRRQFSVKAMLTSGFVCFVTRATGSIRQAHDCSFRTALIEIKSNQTFNGKACLIYSATVCSMASLRVVASLRAGCAAAAATLEVEWLQMLAR